MAERSRTKWINYVDAGSQPGARQTKTTDQRKPPWPLPARCRVLPLVTDTTASPRRFGMG